MKNITLLYLDKTPTEIKKELSITFRVDDNPRSYSKNLELIFDEFLAFVKASGFIVADDYELRLSQKRKSISLSDFPNSFNGTEASDFSTVVKNKKSDLIGSEDC